ncbi:MAG: peptide chain release factor 2 [Candidatus Magasanikbacteria bacterium RIFCSPHIGHO2_02_FULL_41_13]|uniref:Peptide chain release factor 2 n=1 Tax=Candidatus Magasanikbacteria bacterium RIFCSPHIGHO2_02_FULL_41_13 TaxID=1798676 RepID=A0A1F6M3U0_9BACT|nr:MAG: peptide chain release factor 2 [Candidatus Magasanikbacteria bacterium RIFCSPHIGHO2_02_FULL_41_13]
MIEEQKLLEEFLTKVDSTMKLLKIDELKAEKQKLEAEMQAPGFWDNQEQATKVSKRASEITNEVDTWEKMRNDVSELLLLAHDLDKQADAELEAELKKQIVEMQSQFEHLEFYLLLNGKHDNKNAIVAVHAGSGGTEAQDWAEMLRRMLFRYSESKGWKVTILDEADGQEAGIKSCVFHVEGRYTYGHLQSEHGTHRLVRISPFDAESMRHTSFALVEVIPEMDMSDVVQIDPKDLRIDTFMSGGKGGQSVNTTYSAVRIVHIPTGITVQCQNERSQIQNKDTAMKVLHSKLQKLQDEADEKERLELRGEYKSAEWGNQIRSYVLHPYKMVKDIRTRYEMTEPDDVLNGELDPFVESYLRWKSAGKPDLRSGTDE